MTITLTDDPQVCAPCETTGTPMIATTALVVTLPTLVSARSPRLGCDWPDFSRCGYGMGFVVGAVGGRVDAAGEAAFDLPGDLLSLFDIIDDDRERRVADAAAVARGGAADSERRHSGRRWRRGGA